jgi:integrase
MQPVGPASEGREARLCPGLQAGGDRVFRIHDLRHICAAWLVTAGVGLAEVRDLLGHSSITITVKYAHQAPENIRGAVTLLDGTK